MTRMFSLVSDSQNTRTESKRRERDGKARRKRRRERSDDLWRNVRFPRVANVCS